jgi:hypothetical protein
MTRMLTRRVGQGIQLFIGKILCAVGQPIEIGSPQAKRTYDEYP